jgi:hypothetical protein
MTFSLETLDIEAMDFNEQQSCSFRAFLTKQSALKRFGATSTKFDFKTMELIVNELNMLESLSFSSTEFKVTSGSRKLEKNFTIKSLEISYSAESFDDVKELIKILKSLEKVMPGGFPGDALNILQEALKKYAPKCSISTTFY